MEYTLTQQTNNSSDPLVTNNSGGCCGGGCKNTVPPTTPTPVTATPGLPIASCDPSVGGGCSGPTYEPESE